MNEQYNKFLTPNEKIIKILDYANSEVIWDVVCTLCISIIIGSFSNYNLDSILLGLLIGCYFIIIGVYRKMTLKYIITDKRVIVKKGLIGQSTVSADFSQITDIKVREGIFGRILLHTGSIILNTAGTDTDELVLKWVGNPFESKNIIYEQIHKK